MEDDIHEPVGTDSAATLFGKDVLRAEEGKGEDDQPKRTQWDNKIQYLLAQIGFAVGLGNVWRFPYLCQKNGGGAFLIPYLIMMIFEGIPLFYLEIAIGQRLRRGSVGVWNHIHPYLGGVGIASMVVCFFIGLYYNVIISWAAFYFLNSFQTLPWSSCPEIEDPLSNVSTIVEECANSSAGNTSYYWYRETLNISPSIEDPGVPQWKMVLCLLLAWVVVFFGTFKGIKSSGKVVYFSATFPYLVLLIFFFRAITLKGSVDGLMYMVTPDWSRLGDAEVWRDAATQIFFSLGLGFGGVIAYSSYNDFHNDCRKDALTVSLINSATSIFASIVVFAVLGFKAFVMNEHCVVENAHLVQEFFSGNELPIELFEQIKELNTHNYQELFVQINETMYQNDTALLQNWTHFTNTSDITTCSMAEELKEAVSGPGLAFIAFTEAMIHMPGAPFWSLLFFSMLINLGLGSMFGTLEGIITPLKDLGLKLRKEIAVGIICLVSYGIGIIFTLRSGMYVLGLFDTYAGTLPLLLIAFFENIAVIYVYKMKRFSKDIDDMTGHGPPGWFWKMTWYVISPVIMAALFLSSLVALGLKQPMYEYYDKETGLTAEAPYPWWCVLFIVFLISCSIIWIPLIAFLRWRKILPYMEPDSASKKNKITNRTENHFI